MHVGWIGLGKLGLPCALTMANAGHVVCGTDINPAIKDYLTTKSIPYQEEKVTELFLNGATVRWFDTILGVVDHSEIIFVAVQTPHGQEHEGVTRTPQWFQDFEYGYLREAVKELARVITRPTVVVIVSTVLPGTMRREIMPYTQRNRNIHFVYSPAFVAMGTVVYDWSNPEMVIAGCEDDVGFNALVLAHRAMHNATILRMSIEEAEATKLLYNLHLSTKVVMANATMELAHKIGADCDVIVNALGQATDRIVSARYMRGGMGDGGACHPRDAIAMAWFAQRLNLSVNPFEWLMKARDKQTQWVAELAESWADKTSLPIRICGREYKKGTNITTGSASRLMMSMLPPSAEWCDTEPTEPAVFVIGPNHEKYKTWKWPKGSVVLDVWRMISDQPGVVVIRIGGR